jgi:hypothetical protein
MREVGIRLQNFTGIRYTIPEKKPIFLGYTIQLYACYNGQPAKTFQKWITKIGTCVAALVSSLEKRGMALPLQHYCDNARIAKLRNYQSAGAASRLHIPVYEVNSNLCRLLAQSSWSDHLMSEILPDVTNSFEQMTSVCLNRFHNTPNDVRNHISKLQKSCSLLQMRGLYSDQMPVEVILQLAQRLSALLTTALQQQRQQQLHQT